MRGVKRPKRSKKKIKIPEEMVKRIHQMANTTYQVIGGDLQQAREEMGEGGDMSREELVDVVCDADYMLTHGRDEEAYMFWLTLSFEQARQVVTDGFPFEWYE
jgi:hypothetical protein